MRIASRGPKIDISCTSSKEALCELMSVDDHLNKDQTCRNQWTWNLERCKKFRKLKEKLKKLQGKWDETKCEVRCCKMWCWEWDEHQVSWAQMASWWRQGQGRKNLHSLFCSEAERTVKHGVVAPKPGKPKVHSNPRSGRKHDNCKPQIRSQQKATRSDWRGDIQKYDIKFLREMIKVMRNAARSAVTEKWAQNR